MRQVTMIPLALLSLATMARAQVFTDRALFEAALQTSTVESFESAPLSGSGDSGGVASISFSDFKVDTTPPSAKVVDFPFYGAFNTTPGGKQFLYVDTDVGFVGAKTILTPFQTTYGIGFDYTSIVVGSSLNTVTVEGQTFKLALNPDTTTAKFFGYISTAGQPLSTLTIQTSTNSAYGIDQVTYGSPCPNANVTIGDGCIGPGGFEPRLSGDACMIIGQPFALAVEDANGGALAVFFAGVGTTTIPLGNGCDFLLTPVLPPLFALPLGGTGPGNGSTLLVTTIPASAPSGTTAFLQAIMDHGDGTYATSNAFRITVQ